MPLKYSYPLSCQRGLTVIEVVVTIGLSVMLITALLRFLAVSHPISKVAYLQAQSTEAARVHIRRIAKSLRELRPGDTGAYPLAETLPQRIVFYADVDGDALTERVRYELVGTNLERGVINPTGNPLQYDEETEEATTVVSGVQNGAAPVFTYYTGNYPADTTPLTPTDLTEVKYIQFTLVVDADPAVDPPAATIQSQVQLRNLKTNLGETAS